MQFSVVIQFSLIQYLPKGNKDHIPPEEKITVVFATVHMAADGTLAVKSSNVLATFTVFTFGGSVGSCRIM